MFLRAAMVTLQFSIVRIRCGMVVRHIGEWILAICMETMSKVCEMAQLATKKSRGLK